MGSISRAVKKIARPKVLLPLAAIALGGPALAGAMKGGTAGAALFGKAGAAGTAGGSLIPISKAAALSQGVATPGILGTAGAFAPLKGTLAKGIMAGLKNPFSAKGLMTYGGLGAGALGLMGKEKTEAQKNLGVDPQAQYDLAREMNRMMGGAYTDEQLNTIVAPMLSQYGGEYETITNPMRKRRPMFPGLNYSGLTRYAADGGTIVGDDELSQRLYGEMMGAQMSDNTPDIETLQGIKDYIDYLGEMDQAEKMLREEVPNPIGRAKGGSIPQTPMMPQGMQLDGRGGGFIPMGAQEKKDDVPAMLAKNEFVMTSDAVKAAGGGDINKGAQKMYDLMNSLESKV